MFNKSEIKNLSSSQFAEIFTNIIDLKYSSEEIKKFLLDLNKSGYSLNAFLGAVEVLKSRVKKIQAPAGTIDVCGTGGDKLNTLNISSAVCFVVAGAGVCVAKHGNKAISSKSGSADVLQELGVKISSDVNEIENDLREKKLSFIFAPFFHESLKNLAAIRKELGVPTIFNYLGPLVNPANVDFQLIGTAKKEVMKNMAQVCQQNGKKRVFIVHGMDGMDEATISTDSILVKLENGEISEEILNPEKFGIKKSALEEIKGGDAKYNAGKILELLDGAESAYRDIVVLNSALAILVAGKTKNISDGIELAKESINSGKAMNILRQIINN